MVEEYIADQEGESIHDESRFVIGKNASYRLLSGIPSFP
jgi:hypothetical protein